MRPELAEHLARDYGIPLDEAVLDPEFLLLQEQSRRLSADPDGAVGRLTAQAARRLAAERFTAELHRACADLRERLASGREPPYLVAEALQIVAGDLPLIEEMAAAGVPGEVVDALCADLVEAALFTAGRLVLNLGRQLQARRRTAPVPIEADKVRPLARVIEAERPEVLGRLGFAAAEPVLVVATAGRGTRLRTTIPKALIPLAGGLFLTSILAAARRAGVHRTVAVVKHRASLHPVALGPDLTYVVQREALGTGHSFASALSLLRGHEGPCMLSYSDTPFLTPGSFRRVLEPVASGQATMTALAVATQEYPEYGRLEERGGRVRAIFQPRLGQEGGDRADAGLYACRVADALPALLATENRNHRLEYSFTEICAELDRRGHAALAVSVRDPREALGVNEPSDLLQARRLAQALRADLDFFRAHGGASREGLAPSEMLELSDLYGEKLRDARGPTFTLEDPDIPS